MSLIFISHSSRDNRVALDLKERLKDLGHSSVFLDFDPEDGIPAGRDWEKELYRNIRACRAAIVLCSQHSMGSKWCFMEITHARALGKPIFPVKIDDCSLDGVLADRQVVDFSVNTEDGFERLKRGLLAAGVDPAAAFEWDSRRPPYPGLLALQEADAAVFFGRDDEIGEALDLLNRLRRLGETRLMMVLGASGTGKSSLVRAGLVPRLRHDEERWLVIDPIRPRQNPAIELAAALSRAYKRVGERVPWQSVLSRLEPGADSSEISLDAREERRGIAMRDRDPISGIAEELNILGGRSEARVVLIVDQFEELLDQPDNHPTTHFLALLGATLVRSDTPLVVLATMRSDFLGHFQKQPALLGVRYESLSLGPMSREGITAVIEKPAEVAGIELETGLVQALIDDAATADALPLLAFALRELYEKYGEDRLLSIEEYRVKLGGLHGAIAKSAEDLLRSEDVSSSDEEALRRAFLSMVRVTDDGRYARRAVRWADLPEPIHGLLEKFVRARLLVSGADESDKPKLEVAHEALFNAWGRLKGWLDENATALRLAREIQAGAQSWAKEGRLDENLWRGGRLTRARELIDAGFLPLDGTDLAFIEAAERAERQVAEAEEARRRQTLRRVVGVAFGALLLAMVAGIFAMQATKARRESNQAGLTAQARQLAAQAELVRTQRGDLLPRSVLLAIESLRLSPSTEAWQILRKGLGLLTRPVAELEHEDSVAAVVFAPHGSLVATASEKTVFLWDAMSGAELARFDLGESVIAIAFSPDGSLLAAAGGGEIEVRPGVRSPRGALRVWELETRREVFHEPTRGAVASLAFNPKGVRLASSGGDQPTRIWDLESGTEALRIDQGHIVAFSADGRQLATRATQSVYVWNVDDGSQINVVHHLHADRVNRSFESVALSQDGHYIATANGDDVRLWEVESGLELTRVMHEGGAKAVIFNPDGRLLATAGSDGTARVLEVASTREIARFEHDDDVHTLAFRFDGSIVTASKDKTARVWDIQTGRELARVTHEGPVNAIALSADNNLLATRASGSTALSYKPYGSRIRISELVTKIESERLPQDTPVYATAFSPNGRLLATGGKDALVIWELAAARKIAHIETTIAAPPIVFSPDGKRLATASQDGRVHLWDTMGGLELAQLEHGENVISIAFSPDGRHIATSGGQMQRAQGTVRVWEVVSGRHVAQMQQNMPVEEGVFGPGGRLLATAGLDGTARVWDPWLQKEVARVRHDDWVSAVAFSPDGALLASAGASSWSISRGDNLDGSVRVLHIASNREIARVQHGKAVYDVAFSPDGSLLATASADGTARVLNTSDWQGVTLAHDTPLAAVVFGPNGTHLATGGGREESNSSPYVYVWEASSGREVARFIDETPIRSFSFSPDGRYLVRAGTDAYLSLWRAEDLITAACARVPRNLTYEEWAGHMVTDLYRRTCTDHPTHPTVTEKAAQLARDRDFAAADRIFAHLKKLGQGSEAEARSLASFLLATKGKDQANRGRIDDALTAFADARRISAAAEIPAHFLNQLCWNGALAGRAADVLKACEEAAARAPDNGSIRDSRGLARALTGDYQGAINDFEFFLEWLKANEEKGFRSPSTKTIHERETWIAQLKEGRNPFDQATLKNLRRE